MTISRSVRLSKKGQLVIPKEMRDALQVRDGDEILLTLEERRVVVSKAAEHARAARGALRGTWGKGKRAIDRYLEGERRSWR
jgi:AbrB family looped-hinge helix DNA binding protein